MLACFFASRSLQTHLNSLGFVALLVRTFSDSPGLDSCPCGYDSMTLVTELVLADARGRHYTAAREGAGNCRWHGYSPLSIWPSGVSGSTYIELCLNQRDTGRILVSFSVLRLESAAAHRFASRPRLSERDKLSPSDLGTS